MARAGGRQRDCYAGEMLDGPAPNTTEIAIDAETGALRVGDMVAIHPHRPLPRMPKALRLRTIRDMRTGYVWHDYEGPNLGGQPCILRVCVHGTTGVERIDLDFIRVESGRPIWADPQEVLREIARGRFVLSGLLNRSFETGLEQFSWGKAYSVYDDRSGGVPHIGVWFVRSREQ